MYVNFPIYQLTFVVCRVFMICTLVFYISVFVVFKDCLIGFFENAKMKYYFTHTYCLKSNIY